MIFPPPQKKKNKKKNCLQKHPFKQNSVVKGQNLISQSSVFSVNSLVLTIKAPNKNSSRRHFNFHLKHRVLFSQKNNEKIFMNVICCSRDWRLGTVNLRYLKLKIHPKLLIFQSKFSGSRKFTMKYQYNRS